MSDDGGASSVKCMAFYATTQNARQQGAQRANTASLPCTHEVGQNTFGWCSCSDSVPRFVDMGSATTTCDAVCASTPAYYTSDLPAVRGTAKQQRRVMYSQTQVAYLTSALAAGLVGLAMLGFALVDSRQQKTQGGERALRRLVEATNVKMAT